MAREPEAKPYPVETLSTKARFAPAGKSGYDRRPLHEAPGKGQAGRQ